MWKHEEGLIDCSHMTAELRVLDQRMSQLAAFVNFAKESSMGGKNSGNFRVTEMQSNAMGSGKQPCK